MEAVLKTGGQEIAGELTEAAIDQAMEEGVLKDIPIIGTFAKLYSGGGAVRDIGFAHKLRRFFIETSAVSEEDKEMFVIELELDPEERRRVGEYTLAILDGLDEQLKASMFGALFASHVRGEVDFYAFQTLARALDRSLLGELKILLAATRNRGPAYWGAACPALESVGMLVQSGTTGIAGANPHYNVTQHGKLAVRLWEKYLSDVSDLY